MDTFGKWLMQANARAVLAGSVLALLLVCGWWIWRERAPLDITPGIASPAPAPSGPATLGLLDFLQSAHAVTNRLDHSCFGRTPWAPKPLVRPTEPPVQTPIIIPQIPPVNPPPTNQLPVQPPPPPVPPTPPPPPPPPPETIRLTYRGLFQRPDGEILAWIEDSKTQRTAFYRIGDTIQGLTLKSIDGAALQIHQADNTPVILPLREPIPFTGGKHAAP